MQSFVHLFVGISAVRSLTVAEPTNCNSGVYCHFCDPCNSLSRASGVSASLRWLGCGVLFSPTVKQLLMRAAKRSLLLRELFHLGYQSPCWWNPRLNFLLACLRTVDPSPGLWGLLWCAVIPHSSPYLSECLLGSVSILPMYDLLFWCSERETYSVSQMKTLCAERGTKLLGGCDRTRLWGLSWTLRARGGREKVALPSRCSLRVGGGRQS